MRDDRRPKDRHNFELRQPVTATWKSVGRHRAPAHNMVEPKGCVHLVSLFRSAVGYATSGRGRSSSPLALATVLASDGGEEARWSKYSKRSFRKESPRTCNRPFPWLVKVSIPLLTSFLFPSQSNAQAAAATALQHRDENGEGMRRSQGPVAITISYNSDLNSDVSGGARRGVAYLQRLIVVADADLARALGWDGATAHISVQSIAGTGLSESRVHNLLVVSGLEAPPALGLFNLWIEQRIGKIGSLRVGQFTAGQEFAISPTANLFVNSTFGWPGSFAEDLPGGGPAYPIAVPGVRFAATFDHKKTTIRAAAFAGDPPGRDEHGFSAFKFQTPPLVITEIAHNSGGKDPAWSVVAGGWASFDHFADRKSPLRRTLAGNEAVYVSGDARLWTQGKKSVHGFARFTLSSPDRNLVNLYVDTGVSITGAFRSRPKDVIGLAIAVARISSATAALATDGEHGGTPPPEIALEASYQFNLSDILYFQPNAQIILNPYDIADDNASTSRQWRRRAVVIGLRTSFRY
jgi:porin